LRKTATGTLLRGLASRRDGVFTSGDAVLWRVVILFLLTLFPSATSAAAQTLSGRVLEEGRDVPVAGAMISLVDRNGKQRAGATSDSVGRFVLTPPEPGEYVVQAVRLGYEPTRSPLFAMAVEGSVPFEIMMKPSPIGLEGFEVTVEREAEVLLRNFGHTPATLGNRWIGREDIDRMPLPVGPLEVIRWRAIPGVVVDEGFTPGTASLCVTFVRRSRSGCALILLNGVPISPFEAQAINPDHIEAIAILTPVDATTFYGTQAGGGAVLMWTRQGGSG
jgi:Carboxypeptidase regulatory-like domain